MKGLKMKICREHYAKNDCFSSHFTCPEGRESSKVEFFPIVAPIIKEFLTIGDQLMKFHFLLQLPEMFVEIYELWNNSKLLHF